MDRQLKTIAYESEEGPGGFWRGMDAMKYGIIA